MIDRSALRRSPRRKYHVEVESETVRDTNLSYRSLGILTYCLDQHESWQVRSEQLSRGEGREGRDAIRKSLHQLAKYGYYRLERRRFRDGKTVMGAAISEYPMDQWARDYEIFGEDLTIPVVEQQDGSWQVRYPDDTYGPDGITAGTAPGTDDVPAGGEQTSAPEPEADTEETPATEVKRPLPPAARAAAEQKKRRPAAPRATKKKPDEDSADGESSEPKTKTPAQEVASWYYDHATKHLGPYAGPKKSGWYFGLVQLSKQALEAGYEQQQVAKAFQRTGVHWPNAPHFQRALSDERNNAPMPARYGGRPALYNDAATWGPIGSDDPPTAPVFDEPVFSVVPA
ncbi:hypothetical protein [Streptomyces sp. NRRL B-24572]|uniref:hypothetical protein n=1 Tax=Streptomyces sp. NRRL B-24572 TaxID=1962156 RepID=UPI000A3BC569|nr:hypothetical protein [Streptomyces sp. NRRL B-24572]